MRKIIQISRKESKMIRAKYPKFNIMSTCVEKSNHNRGKKYIQPYILFSECEDVMRELSEYIDVYEMIETNYERAECLKNFKNQLAQRTLYIEQKNNKKNAENKKIEVSDERDEIINCKFCNAEFKFSAKEKEHYASKGYSNPIRCFDCRKIKNQNNQST